MSIFREGFNSEIIKQLKKREDAMLNRTTENIQYINSRNAWIRMASSVNVGGKSDLAQAYVLQGGTLNNGASSNWSFKTGIGETGKEAYSTKTPYGTDHKLGIRPMPGITGIDVKSKSAYGSLREVTVNFQCWDIRQLEELELLYMRPGYTVLVEWGWVPYLDNTKGYTSTFNDFYSDTILTSPPSERSAIFKTLYDRSITNSGNYDAMFGYVKNYNWSARPDGGYDCQTIIISTGEIIESLKVNYVLPNLKDYGMYDANGKGFLNNLITDGGVTTDKYRPAYEKNTLAGIWTELYWKWYAKNSTLVSGQKTILDIQSLSFPGTINADDSMIAPGSQIRIYIDLESVFNILNEYIIAKDSKEELIKLSTRANTYSSNGNELTCVAHPLQISTDPLVCLIKNTTWENKILTTVASNTQATAAASTTAATTIAEDIIKGFENIYTDGQTAVDAINDITTPAIYQAVNEYFKNGTNPAYQYNNGLQQAFTEKWINNTSNINDFGITDNNGVNQGPADITVIYYLYKVNEAFKNGSSGTTCEFKITDTSNNTIKIEDFLTGKTTPNSVVDMAKLIDPAPSFYKVSNVIYFNYEAKQKPSSITLTVSTQAQTSAALTLNSQDAVDCIAQINKTLKYEYFSYTPVGATKQVTDYTKEIGTIGNIYICLDFLYKLSISGQMESQDSKEKQEINLYSYIKNIASGMNAALGSVSNFEIHVDPVDNIGRIIDVNYCEPDKKSASLHEFPIQTLNSVIRNFKLESKIFPNQSAIIAIGAQASGGQLGIQNNTMVDYNTTLTDRVLGDKTFPRKANALSKYKNNTSPDMAAGLASIVFLLATMKTQPAAGAQSQFKDASSRARSGLRDLIVYFQNITTSPSANRNIIPTKLSFEMDGIGGLVIGQLFKIDQNILPRGYKGLKGELAHTITGISHTIDNGDWKTNIDSLMIILDNVVSGFSSLNIASIVAAAVQTVISQGSTPTPPGSPPGPPGPPPPPGAKDPLAGKVHIISYPDSTYGAQYVNQSPTALKVHDLALGTNSDRPRSKAAVTQIILHSTCGWGNAEETYQAFVTKRSYIDPKTGQLKYFHPNIHYSIDKGGGIIHGLGVDWRCVHADNLNETSVGIEICNLHSFTWDASQNKWYSIAASRYLTPDGPQGSALWLQSTQNANINRPSGWGGKYTDLTYKYNDYQYFEDYTDPQIAALEWVIRDILRQCPNVKINFQKSNPATIFTNVFGVNSALINPSVGFPRAGVNAIAIDLPSGTTPGIYSHARSTSSTSHTDTFPSLKMINLLNKIDKTDNTVDRLKKLL